MGSKNQPYALSRFDIVLKSDKTCSSEEISNALKKIFNMDSDEIEKATQAVSKKGSVVIENVHGEKLDLRKEQLKSWKEKGGQTLPISYIKAS